MRYYSIGCVYETVVRGLDANAHVSPSLLVLTCLLVQSLHLFLTNYGSTCDFIQRELRDLTQPLKRKSLPLLKVLTPFRNVWNQSWTVT